MRLLRVLCEDLRLLGRWIEMVKWRQRTEIMETPAVRHLLGTKDHLPTSRASEKTVNQSLNRGWPLTCTFIISQPLLIPSPGDGGATSGRGSIGDVDLTGR